jgi:hypothetical protein
MLEGSSSGRLCRPTLRLGYDVGGQAVPIHHEGTKGTKASSAVQDPSHAVPEEFDIEVDE